MYIDPTQPILDAKSSLLNQFLGDVFTIILDLRHGGCRERRYHVVDIHETNQDVHTLIGQLGVLQNIIILLQELQYDRPYDLEAVIHTRQLEHIRCQLILQKVLQDIEGTPHNLSEVYFEGFLKALNMHLQLLLHE